MGACITLWVCMVSLVAAYVLLKPTSPGFPSSRLRVQSQGDESPRTSLLQSIRSPGLSTGAGVTGIFVLLANRLSVDLDKVTDVQSRADIISVVACSALLLNVLSDSDIEARDRSPVPLMGYALPSPLLAEGEALNAMQRNTALWAIESILKTTPATSVHIVRNEKQVVARGGVIGLRDDKAPSFTLDPNMSIFDKAITQGEEVYLPDLQILPGKIEFNFLPANAQSLVILPLQAAGGAVVISTNQAKVMRLNDLQKIRVVCALINMAF